MSAVPSVVATILVWLWLTGGHGLRALLGLVTEPLVVSRTGYFPSGGDSNLMDMLESLMVKLHAGEDVISAVTLGAALLVCGVVLYLAARRHAGSSVQWQMSLMATMSFGLFRHYPYDSVVLLFPLCYALRFWNETRARIILGLIGYLWYVQRVLDAVKLSGPRFVVMQFMMLMVILILTYQMRPMEERMLPAWSATASKAPFV